MILSGLDEQKPRCIICNGEKDILVRDISSEVMGWIVCDEDEKELGVDIVLSLEYSPSQKVGRINCLEEGKNEDEHKIYGNAKEYFLSRVKAGHCMSWKDFHERDNEGLLL